MVSLNIDGTQCKLPKSTLKALRKIADGKNRLSQFSSSLVKTMSKHSLIVVHEYNGENLLGPTHLGIRAMDAMKGMAL